MAFFGSIENSKFKKIFLSYFALSSISSNLMAELDFDRLFPLIIGNVTEAMGAERTTMYVVDQDKREIWSKVSEGIGQVRLPMGHGISGRVAETG